MAKIVKSFRLDSELIQKAEKLAKADNRSLNNWIECLIRKEVEKTKVEIKKTNE